MRHPTPIRPGRREGAADQIGRGRGGRISARRALGLAPTHARHADGVHQAGDALAAHVHAVGGQLGVPAGHPVGAARARMNRLDLGAQGDVGPGARRQRPPAPRVVPAGGDPQDPAQGGETMGRPVSPRILGWDRAGLLGKPGPLFAEGLVLPPQPTELLPLVGREAISPLPGIAIGLGQPVADGLGGRLELLRQRLRRAALPHQFDDPLPKLRWVWRSTLRHRGLLPP